MNNLPALCLLVFVACDTPQTIEAGCGNGVIEFSEVCDDGNDDNSDSCLTSCVEASCGDGFVQLDLEACDDGNAIEEDGCDSRCHLTGNTSYDDDGDCFCELAPCTGSLEPSCEEVVAGDCDDSNATVSPVASDEPDLSALDSNCDGIDGDFQQVIFVKTDGNPRALGTSPAAAVPSIEIALMLANNTDRAWILISGDYAMMPLDPWSVGVNLAGGYDAAFVTRAGRSTLSLPSSGLVVQGAAVATWQSLAFVASDAVDPGAQSVALILEGTYGLILENCSVGAGDGAAGESGISGRNGVAGGAGGVGGPGGGRTFATRGAAGSSRCAATGGYGGTGSLSGNPPVISARGENAATLRGEPPALGGAAGVGNFSSGSPGANGRPGPLASPGAHAGQDTLWVNRALQLQSGAVGGSGYPGGGGGGGGGGSGRNAIQMIISGGGGGGGGGGGCGGEGGNGGSPGGSSVGIVLDDASVQLLGSEVISGNGGEAGHGGQGGSGGISGPGGAGGPLGNAFGGAGGRGASGGSAGQGGSGVGGASIAVYCQGTSDFTQSSATLSTGAPGAAVNGGHAGVQAETTGCD
jgi:cysteine-rich repeat protein